MEPARQFKVIEGEQLPPETARLFRILLERIAQKIEREAVSSTYRSALNRATKIIRESKPD